MTLPPSPDLLVRGRRQAYAVCGVLLALQAALVVGVYWRVGEVSVGGLVRLAVTVVLAAFLTDGRSWARLLLAAWAGFVAVTGLIAAAAFSDAPAAAALMAGYALVSGGCAAALIASEAIGALTRVGESGGARPG